MAKFYNYLNNININLSDKNDPDILKEIEDPHALSDIMEIIDSLNKDLGLNKNKIKFYLTDNKSLPTLKIRDEESLIEKWLVSNENLVKIKKDMFMEKLKKI